MRDATAQRGDVAAVHVVGGVRRLDPHAGRLSRRDLRRAVIAAVAVVALLVASYLAATSGLLVAHLAHGHAGGYGDGRDIGVIHYDFEVVNDGQFAIEILDVGRSGPGLEQVPFPSEIGGHYTEVVSTARLRPGEKVFLGVAYRVTDCDAVPDEPWPVPVRVDRWWGTQTVWIVLPTQSREGFQLPPDRTHNGAVSWDWDVEWQRNLADAHCYYADGGQPWSFDDPGQ
jgi:hypothetical protein